MNEFVEQDIIELLLADSDVRDLLTPSPGADPVFYWGTAPPVAFTRYAILARVGDDSDSTNDGASGMEDAQFTVTCWSRNSAPDATRLANAIKARLKTLCGTSDLTHAGRPIQGVFYLGQSDAAAEPWDGGEVIMPGRVVRLRVVYEDNETA